MKDIKGAGNKIEIEPSVNFNCELQIHGNDNIVEIDKSVSGHLTLNIVGNNHRVSIDKGVKFFSKCVANFDGECSALIIGERSTFQGSQFHLNESNTSIVIGKDCIFAPDTLLMTSDFHSIFDLVTGLRINPARDITICDHVWLGWGTTVLKGVTIESNSVIGTKSVVTKNIPENVIAVGVPAKVVRKDITWDWRLLDQNIRPGHRITDTCQLSNSTLSSEFNIDSLSGVKQPFQTRQPIVIDGADVEIKGWAVDISNESIVGGVHVLVDECEYASEYGLPRPDVATAKGAQYKYSGFRLCLPISEVGKGKHTISVRVITRDLKSYYSAPERTLSFIIE